MQLIWAEKIISDWTGHVALKIKFEKQSIMSQFISHPVW